MIYMCLRSAQLSGAWSVAHELNSLCDSRLVQRRAVTWTRTHVFSATTKHTAESPGATREAHPERRTDSNGGVPPHSPAGELRFRAGELRFRRRAHVAAPRKGSLRSTQIQRAWQPTRGGSFKCGAAEVERAAQTVGGGAGGREATSL